MSSKEATELLATSQPALILIYPDPTKQHLGPEHQGEPDLDPYFAEVVKKGTLVIKINLPTPPQEPDSEDE